MQPTTGAEREEQRKAASERRKARRLWRREILARVAGGESRLEIAAEKGVSIRTVQRALKRAAAERPRESRQIYAGLQIERLHRALRLADARIAQGDLNGVYAMTKLMPLVLHYEKFERETSETMREEYDFG
jgi:predicted transcriptional regulator